MRRSTVYSYDGAKLKKHWSALHGGDREAYPSPAHVSKLAKSNERVARWLTNHGGAARVSGALEDAWRAFHAGEFADAIRAGGELGALGAGVANKSAAILTLYLERNERKRLGILSAAIERGEAAVESLPDYANAHYTLALVLGRYSQRISIVQAVASGYATQIREHLERTLELEPKHAEAHVALGLYHAELVRTLGGLAARFTFGASEEDAIEHFRRAIRLAPGSAIARVEYAHGLLLLDADGNRDEVEKLCAAAATRKPLDVMEELDVERAKTRCTHGG